MSSYADITVRWLAQHHPEYVTTGGKTPYPERLARALNRMSWRHVEVITKAGASQAAYAQALKDEAAEWNSEDHMDMVKWLEAGGHKAELLAHHEAMAKADSDKVLVVGPGGETEELGIEVDEFLDGLKPDPQLSPEHELKEIVEEAALQQDARYGAW